MTENANEKPQTPRRRGHGRAAFIAQLEDIKAWHKSGRTLREYFDLHQDRLPLRYRFFMELSQRYITGKKSHDQRPEAPPSAQASPVGPKRLDVTSPRFVHHADPGDPNDLI